MAYSSGLPRLVLPDSNALSLFEHDPCVKIVEKGKELAGYELYVVEQWATSRQHLTSLMTNFTGLDHHKIKVNVLEIPAEETDWSPRLQTYIQNTSKPPARRKETPLGTLMVTNISSFASTLTVVNIPGGNFDEYRDLFVVNENLKRLGCSGRAGLTLSTPSGATQAKFRELYHTSSAIPVTEAAVELVKLCQAALVLYNQLAREYTDGLLCDLTVNAIKNWWLQIGSEHFNIEPNDGILGPTTVSALLGLLQGARIRLQSLNAPIGKDVFDLKSTKRAIEAFQKWYKLERTRRLDAITLDRLHKLTSKNVNSEGWMVPRAVKSTIPQLGKGGEMVMGMVSNKDKAGIGEVETLDINTFASTASGDSVKWLWHGKRKHGGLEDSLSRFSSEDEPFSADDTPPKAYRKRDIVLDRMPMIGHRGDQFYNNPIGSQVSLEFSDREQPIHRNVLKSVTGRMYDAKSGLGRIRDAVGIPGFRGHTSRLSKEQTNFGNDSFMKSGSDDMRSVSGGNQEPTTILESTAKSNNPSQTDHGISDRSPPALRLQSHQILQIPSVTGEDIVNTPAEIEPGDKQLVGSEIDTPSVASHGDADPHLIPGELIRSTSYVSANHTISDDELGIQRTLSFGTVSDAIFDTSVSQNPGTSNADYQYADDRHLTELALSLRKQLKRLKANDLTVSSKLLQDIYHDDAGTMEEVEVVDKHYFRLLGEHDEYQQETADVVTSARSALGDTLLRIEGVMAKLEYELNMLTSKVEDVEDGVADFQEQVLMLEARTDALEPEEKKQSNWPLRWLGLLLGFA